jgi:hypothetical protein
MTKKYLTSVVRLFLFIILSVSMICFSNCAKKEDIEIKNDTKITTTCQETLNVELPKCEPIEQQWTTTYGHQIVRLEFDNQNRKRLATNIILIHGKMDGSFDSTFYIYNTNNRLSATYHTHKYITDGNSTSNSDTTRYIYDHDLVSESWTYTLPNGFSCQTFQYYADGLLKTHKYYRIQSFSDYLARIKQTDGVYDTAEFEYHANRQLKKEINTTDTKEGHIISIQEYDTQGKQVFNSYESNFGYSTTKHVYNTNEQVYQTIYASNKMQGTKTYIYNKNGCLAQTQDVGKYVECCTPISNTTFTRVMDVVYDEKGRRKAEIGTENSEPLIDNQYIYNADGSYMAKVKEKPDLSYPNFSLFIKDYNNKGEVLKENNLQTAIITTYVYYPNGLLWKEDTSNGTSYTCSYKCP